MKKADGNPTGCSYGSSQLQELLALFSSIDEQQQLLNEATATAARENPASPLLRGLVLTRA